jgi:hypothetical protein
MAQSIILYTGSDAYKSKNDVQNLGYDKNTTFGEMIDLAIEHKCCLLVKHGKGKWYLKGKGKEYNIVKNKLETNTGNPHYRTVKSWLIKF